jgi:hypothetical protein
MLRYTVDIGPISNGAHFFRGNVFKYRLNRVIGMGQSFGELADQNQVEQTIVTLEDTMLGVLGKVGLNRLTHSMNTNMRSNCQMCTS